MFRKITGIVGAIAVIGVIVMVVRSPRAEGFFPGMFDFLKPSADSISAPAPQENPEAAEIPHAIIPEAAEAPLESNESTSRPSNAKSTNPGTIVDPLSSEPDVSR